MWIDFIGAVSLAVLWHLGAEPFVIGFLSLIISRSNSIIRELEK